MFARQEGQEGSWHKLPEEMKLHNLICEALYGIVGGANASFKAGAWAADKYAKHILKRKARKNKNA